MALIKGGVSGVELEIDAVPKAARVVLYNADGTQMNPVPSSAYIAPIEIIPTTLTTGLTYWAMRNTGSKSVWIRSLELKIGFSGTAAATRSLYEMLKFTTATPTGGTAITPVKRNNVYPATSVGDIRFAPAGLAVAGLVFGPQVNIFGHANQLSADTAQDMKFDIPLVLDVNEGLAFRSYGAVVAGSYIVGSIRWEEY